MKHKLLSLVALAGATFMSTSAWAWDEPQEVVPAKTEATAPVDGGVYFLYNVGTQMYIGAGNNYGTHVVVSAPDDELNPFNFWDAEVALGSGSTFILPVKVTAANDGTFYMEHMGSTKGSYYLTSEDGNSWIDGNAGRRIDFTFTAVDGGYQIQATNTVEAGTFFGVATPTEEPAEGESPVYDVMNNIDETGNIVWQFIGTNYAAYVAYDVRKEFYDLLVKADELGVSTTEAGAVYNNANATKEQIEAAANTLKTKIHRAEWTEAWADATEDNPRDVTDDCLVNPAFDAGNISGWTTNYVSGQQANNIGYQGASYTNGDVTISKFIEAWKSNGTPWTVGDGYLQQTVYGMPAGKYVLEADAISNYQYEDHSTDGGIGKNPAEGVFLFIQAGQLEAKQAIATGNGQPEHFKVTFINDEADVLTFGLKTESATANWIAADNFRIWYYGHTNESIGVATLKSVIAEMEAAEIDESDNANADVLSTFFTELGTAQDMVEGTPSDDDCFAQAQTLRDALAAVVASKADYTTFAKLIEEAEGYETIAAGLGDAAAQAVGDLVEQWQDLYDNRQATSEQIAGFAGLARTTLLEYVTAENITPGADLTFMMQNPGFDTNLDGWTVKSGATPAVSSGLAEVYQAKFDIAQTIHNLPAGVYEVSLYGFTRNQPGGDRKAFTPEQQEGTTFELYGGINSEKIQNILAGGSLVLLNQRGDETDPSDYIGVDNGTDYDIAAQLEDGTVIYMPNGMASARTHFDNGGYKTSVKVILDQAGDMTIGLRCTSTQEWCLWDDLQLTFLGEDNSVYEKVIADKTQELNDLMAGENAFITQEGTVKANNAIKAGEDAVEGEECVAAIEQLNEAIAYITEGNELGKELDSQVEFFDGMVVMLENPGNDDTFNDALSNAQEAVIDQGLSVRNNAAVKDMVNNLYATWPAYVQGGYAMGTATEEFPLELKGIIINSQYNEALPTAGWNCVFDGGAQQANYNEFESYNNNSFNVSQTLKGMTPGFYRIEVDAYYRSGFPDVLTAESKDVCNAYLYGETSAGTKAVPVLNALAGAEEYSLGVGAESAVTIDEATLYIPNDMEAAEVYLSMGSYHHSLDVNVGENGELTVGMKKDEHIDGDWTIFTNWKLSYLGTTSTGVQSVKTATSAAQIFSISGTQQNTLRRGVNIVKQNGSVQKVLVK